MPHCCDGAELLFPHWGWLFSSKSDCFFYLFIIFHFIPPQFANSDISFLWILTCDLQLHWRQSCCHRKLINTFRPIRVETWIALMYRSSLRVTVKHRFALVFFFPCLNDLYTLHVTSWASLSSSLGLLPSWPIIEILCSNSLRRTERGSFVKD